MVIELRVVQFWSEIILVISNRTRAARSFDFEITHMISDQIALLSLQLPSLINLNHMQFNIWLIWYIILFIDSFIARTLESTNDQLPTSVFEAQLVWASHRYREVTGSNPVEVLKFSGFSTQLLKLRS